MKRLLMLGLLLTGVSLLMGCVDDSRRRVVIVGADDVIPPAEPRDVYSITGDGRLTLYWSPPRDPDLAGFSVYISQDDQDYYLVADVGATRRHFVVTGDVIASEVPFDLINGNTYYLGVTTFDHAGNECDLTDGVTTFDTPRPAGRDLRLFDINGSRGDESGYDFSRSPYGYAMEGGSLFADIYFAVESGVPVMRTAHPQVVEMIDAGALDFDDDRVGWLSEEGWHPSPSLELEIGHVYLVKIFEETRPGNFNEPFNVAKFQVVSLASDSVWIDWAYQLAPNNRELKPVAKAVEDRSSKKREVWR